MLDCVCWLVVVTEFDYLGAGTAGQQRKKWAFPEDFGLYRCKNVFSLEVIIRIASLYG